MVSYKAYFKGKKVTVLGLGLLGKGLGDVRFLSKCGARVTVTDLKTKEQLAPSVKALKKYKNINFVLGRHDFSDFENCDFVIKAQGVPLNSPYIAHARKKSIPIRMDDELFLSFAPKITTIGVTGTRGKTTTATLLYTILKKSGKRVHLAGNIRGVATLELLPKVKKGDIVVLELSSWQLQGFGETKRSPDISIFTNFLSDHMNYYKNTNEYFKDKANIFLYQKKGNTLIIDNDLIKKLPKTYKGKIIPINKKKINKQIATRLKGEHNLVNIAFAIKASKLLGVKEKKAELAVKNFKAVHGRLEYIKKVNGVEIYNDNSSSTAVATLAALHSFAPNRKIVLISGGRDKGPDLTLLVKTIPRYVKAVVLMPGTGTNKLLSKIHSVDVYKVQNIKQALDKSLKIAKKGDTVLFSPAFASFGQFKNVYDRGDQFVKMVKSLK